jgi:MoxR-like ATPase
MIPETTAEKLKEAMAFFDGNLRNTKEWQRWEQSENFKYAIEQNGQYYPVKEIISLATGVSTHSFSGGGEANYYATERGLNVVPLRPDLPGSNAEETILQESFEAILREYVPARTRTPFSTQNLVWSQFQSIQKTLESSEPVRSRPTLKIKPSTGQGNWAKVPWIALLDSRETNTTQSGVYCVYLFREDMNGVYLTFNQGITEPINRLGRVQGYDFLRTNGAKLRQLSRGLIERGFMLDDGIDLRTAAALGTAYEVSTIAYKFYETNAVPEDAMLIQDLDAVLSVYDQYLKSHNGEREEKLRQNIWMFQANPDKYNLITELKESEVGDKANWTVSRYQEDMRPGDRVVFWVSGKESGIYAVGELLGEPYKREEKPTEEDLKNHPYLQIPWSVDYKYTNILDKPLLRIQLQDHPVLKDLNILKFAQATTFKVTTEQWHAINQLIVESLPASPSYSKEEALSELFLSGDELESILSRIRRKQNLIIQGPPGVGKTFVARRLAYVFMGSKDASRVEMVQFHQSYSYEDFIQGYRPNKEGKFLIKDGIFYKFCLRARSDSDRPYFFIIDEINRGNLSKIFGEIMMLVEQDKRGKDFAIPLTYSEDQNDRFYIPQNLYLIGMMNTADRSLSMVDYALRRRFAFATLEPKFSSDKFALLLRNAGASVSLINKIRERFSSLNENIAEDQRNLGPGYRIGHSYFCPGSNPPSLDERWYREVVKSEISPLLEEYWLDDVGKAEEYISQLLA